MKSRKLWTIIAMTMCLSLIGCFQNVVSDTKIPRMAKEELQLILGRPDIIIVDVRVDDEWKKSQWKIKGAVREDPEKEIQSWIEKYPKDKTFIFY